MITKELEGEMLFVIALLEDSFGGAPTIGLSTTGEYIVVSSCGCDTCLTFKSIYQPKVSNSLIGAAKNYGDDWICFNQTKDMMDAGSRKH